MQMQGMGAPGGGMGAPGGGMGGGFGGGAPTDSRPPRERYATELNQLKEMGFTNEDTNL